MLLAFGDVVAEPAELVDVEFLEETLLDPLPEVVEVTRLVIGVVAAEVIALPGPEETEELITIEVPVGVESVDAGPLVPGVTIALVSVVEVVVAGADVDVAVGAPTACCPVMNDGLYVAVPSYAAQPGTVVLGGALPPPQSRNAQISPVPGTQ